MICVLKKSKKQRVNRYIIIYNKNIKIYVKYVYIRYLE